MLFPSTNFANYVAPPCSRNLFEKPWMDSLAEINPLPQIEEWWKLLGDDYNTSSSRLRFIWIGL